MALLAELSFQDIQLQRFFMPEGVTLEEVLWQAPIIVLLYVAAWLLKRKLAPPDQETQSPPGLECWRKENATFLWFFAFLGALALLGQLLPAPLEAVQIVFALVGLWLIVALLTAYSRDRIMVRLVVMVLYIVVSLYLLRWFNPVVDFLDHMELSVGKARISIFGILTGIFVLIVMLWLAGLISRVIDSRIRNIGGLSSSVKVLIGKAIKIVLIVAALLIAVDSMGIDLTVLTVLGGGLGVGLGFGLQKVVSNLVSGFILLTDKSIKPGDVIEIDNTFGWINNLSARYVSVITRDGTEHLIPNEDLITQRVINWSFTDNLVRQRIGIGISYNSDPHKAKELVLEAISKVSRVLKDPAPICHLVEFGDSSLNLEARVWIEDPANGVTNVKNEILMNVWDSFKEHGIEIPFPQRDVHIKTMVNPHPADKPE